MFLHEFEGLVHQGEQVARLESVMSIAFQFGNKGHLRRDTNALLSDTYERLLKVRVTHVKMIGRPNGFVDPLSDPAVRDRSQ
jgi:hypothetical protein